MKKVVLSGLFIVIFASLFWVAKFSADAANCCFNECNLADPPKCSANTLLNCGECDTDRYNDWCPAASQCSGNTVCYMGACAICDEDSDGSRNAACGGNDCDDSRNFVRPGAQEICDGIDNNCNGQVDENCDIDQDRYCSASAQIFNNTLMCPLTIFTSDGMNGNDCDDNNAAVHPGTAEICTDARDNDCNGQIDCADASCSASSACCTENWTCTAWSACSGGNVSRACTDQNSCGSIANRPPQSAPCLTAQINAPASGITIVSGSQLPYSATAAGGIAPLTYQWTLSSSPVINFSSSINGSADTLGWPAGNFSITFRVNDNTGQTATATVPITILPAGTFTAVIQASANSFVRNQAVPAIFSAQVTGGTGALTYQWDAVPGGSIGNAQGITVDVSAWSIGAHIINLTVTDSAARTATAQISVTITEMSILVLPADGNTTEAGYTVWFSAAASGGIGPYSCAWTMDGAAMNNTCAFSRNNIAVGNHNISVVVRDSSIPAASANSAFQIQILPLTPLALSIISPASASSFNIGDTVSFSASLSGGVRPYTAFRWLSSINGVLRNGTAAFMDETSLVFSSTLLNAGNHTISLSVTDGAGNVITRSVNITVSIPAPLTASIESPADGDFFERTLDTINFRATSSGGVAPITYQWNSNLDPNFATGASADRNNLSVGTHNITLTVSDSQGNTATDQATITIRPYMPVNNFKDLARYSNRETFLVSDADWRTVLSLVPVAIWKQTTMRNYPALIFHSESATVFDADSSIHFMQLFNTTHLTTIGTIPANLNNLLVAARETGAGLGAGSITNINASGYFSFWTSFDTVVAVDFNNYRTGMAASVFAAQINAPLLFMNAANVASYAPQISGKNVYVAGNLDAGSNSYLALNAAAVSNYSEDELMALYRSRTVARALVIANPLDQAISVNTSYATLKNPSAPILRIFGGMSLAAPFLAAAKEEAIGFVPLNDTGPNSTCVEDPEITANIAVADIAIATMLGGFASTPSGVTIIAAPQALPESQYYDQNAGWQYRHAVDWKYGSLSNVYSSTMAPTGRIYGITVADASSYIAKSIFYQNMLDSLYAGNNSSISVGHGANTHCQEARTIHLNAFAAGYSSVCFNSCNLANCTNIIDPAYTSYRSKNFIAFMDSGSPGQWTSTMSYQNIPWLQLPIVATNAQQTNLYWQSTLYYNLMSANMLKKGSMAYVGSVSSALVGTADVPKNLLTSLGSNQNKSLGQAFVELGASSLSDQVLLGDPTLLPALNHINIPWN
jgi:hypothetical protein